MSVTPKGLSIQVAYRDYSDGKFLVNRKYQRKLVWSRSEKEKLIDSILQGFPIPLILLAVEIEDNGEKRYEILDGMQRLNAVFEFIENKYAFNGRYFDVEQLARAKQRSEDGVFELRNDSLLEPESCADFVDYTLAVTEFPSSNPDAVNEVFGRINAYGRQLSNQEKRQAGVVSDFSNLVRTLSAEIRGDVSKETLDLSEMPSISIDPDDTHKSYGISADETFWCRQGVLVKNQVRSGEDEQFVADLVISAVQDEPFAFSGSNLDNYYNENRAEYGDIERSVNREGPEHVKARVLAALSILVNVFEQVDDTPNAMKRVLNPAAGGNPIKAPFYACFMAFYELCVEEEKSPEDPNAIVIALEDLQSKLEVARGQITADARRRNIDLTKGLISRYFVESDPPSSSSASALAIRFANSLRRSRVETAAYECKQGILNLDSSRDENGNLIARIPQIVCGIANLGPDSEGAIFIGVADTEADAARISEISGVNTVCVGSRYVVGVDREAATLNISLEAYFSKFIDAIKHSALSEPLKSSVLAKIDIFDFRGHSVVSIWVPSQEDLSTLDDTVFVRRGSCTESISAFSEINALQGIFRNSI
ncbi:MAG: DUF262 domain-containing protein [Pseudomonadota bacterium]